MRSNRRSALLGTISAMSAARFLPSIRDQIARLRPAGDRHDDRAGRDGVDDTEQLISLRLGPADVARRRRERARFTDDAAYFEFLVDRATAGRSTPS